MYRNGIMLKPALAARGAGNMNTYGRPEAQPASYSELPAGRTADADADLPAVPAPPGVSTTPDIGVTPEPDIDADLPAVPAPPGVSTTPDIGVTPEPDIDAGLPAVPAPPGVSTTPDISVTPEDSFPSFPAAGYCNIRFLFAAVDTPPVNVILGSNLIINGLSFGQSTTYTMEPAGLRTITIRNSAYPYSILNQSAFRFLKDKVYTIALLNSPGGLVLYLIEDAGCDKSIYQSCIRAVNLSYDVPTVNFLLADSRILFSNVSYAAITNYRQIMPGNYNIVVTDRSQCPTPLPSPRQSRMIQIIPIIIGGGPGSCSGNTLVSGNFYIAENMSYTLYLIGSAHQDPSLMLLLL